VRRGNGKEQLEPEEPIAPDALYGSTKLAHCPKSNLGYCVCTHGRPIQVLVLFNGIGSVNWTTLKAKV